MYTIYFYMKEVIILEAVKYLKRPVCALANRFWRDHFKTINYPKRGSVKPCNVN